MRSSATNLSTLLPHVYILQLTDNLRLHRLPVIERRLGLDHRRRRLHRARHRRRRSLLPLYSLASSREERPEEARLFVLGVDVQVPRVRLNLLAALRVGRTGLRGWVEAVVDYLHSFVAVEEVGVGGVDIASLHADGEC